MQRLQIRKEATHFFTRRKLVMGPEARLRDRRFEERPST